MRTPSLARFIVLAACLLLLLGGALAAKRRFAPTGSLPGLRIDGAELEAGADVRAFVAARAQAIALRRVELALETGPVFTESGAPFSCTLGELGVGVDVERVVEETRALLVEGDLGWRADLARRASRGEIDVPLAPTVDPSVARPILERIKDQEDRPPISARVDLEHRAVIPERDGRYIDIDGAIAAISRAARDGASVGSGCAADLPSRVVLPVASFPAHLSTAFVAQVDTHALLGEYETYFSRTKDQARRGKNIDVAAAKVDGLVLTPGELVSFNDVVGERSEENGFEKSWEIYKGEMIEGVGGGTCQVASTFFAAVFFGGLDVIERLPHSRPSAYIPMGLDATVVYPIVDLKVRNPYDFPVVVHAQVEKNRLKMSVFGAKKIAHVSFEREVVETHAYKRKVVEEPKLRFSKKVVWKQHGIRGYKIKRTRTMWFTDGSKRKKESTVDLYPSTTEIYEVPPGFDVSLLPPLPPEDEDSDGRSAAQPGLHLEEGSDTSAAAAASAVVDAPVPPPPVPPVVSPCAPGCSQAQAPAVAMPLLDVIEGPGAHAPTEGQANPPKMLTVTR